MTSEPTGTTDAPTDATPAGSAAATARGHVLDARPRRGVPAAVPVAVVLDLALLCLGVVLLRELLVGREVAGDVLVPGEPWLAPALGSATSVLAGTTAAVAGASIAVLGALLLLLALARRPRRTATLGGGATPVHLPWRSVAALAADAALRADEVEASRASASGRSVVVDVTLDPRVPHDPAAVRADVTGRVEEVLDGLERPVRVRVRTHGVVPR